MTQPFRTVAGGRVDRSQPVTFRYNGTELQGYVGDTLASALLANGVHTVTSSIKFGRARGIAAAGAEDPSGIVQVDEPFPDPMQLATTIELAPGLVAHGVPGQGKLADTKDPARYDAVHLHVDVLVVGSGPAGLVAAVTAARANLRVAIVDEQPEAGGSLLSTLQEIDGLPAPDWISGIVDEISENPRVTHLQRTTIFGVYDDGLALAVQRRTDHLGTASPADALRQRVWRIRARQTIVAAGAHERPVVFADNDRPGIILANSARTYLNRYAVRIGNAVAVFTTNDSAYTAAFELHDAGVAITGIIDSRPLVGTEWLDAAADRGIAVHPGSVVTGTDGPDRLTRISHATCDADVVGPSASFEADSLLVSGGWNPAVHLYSQAGGTLAYDDRLGAFVPDARIDGIAVAGSAAGVFSLNEVLSHGREVAIATLHKLGGREGDPLTPSADKDADSNPGMVLWYVPTGDPPTLHTHFVDLQRDATVADIARAVGAGLRSVEHVKRYTTIGTAHDQGKTSGIISSGITAELSGVGISDLGTTKFRPPYTPVAFATLAGRNRGDLFDPVRVTSVHDWHVENGALFEDVGQWKRPWYYPQPGEDIHAAVHRECAAVRTGVGMLDGTTLGKIDVQGKDAGEFLDLMYTNLMSTLKVGSIRYGVMCGVDGMVLDDGTVLRIDEERFLIFTTTGGAAKILDWLEEWLQTEWPHFRVWLASVTEHWSTFPVVGPKSRALIGELFPDVDVSNEAFPFMTWRDTELDGVPVRLSRVSFSGELAYEVNVVSWFGLDLWKRIHAAGQRYGITTYGTETMHVLRAEKGYPIIGQDTDGTVTPQDLGMSWVVSKKKLDFVGKRSFARSANNEATRRQLVGVLPIDHTTLLPEGTQLVSVDSLAETPVPMHGFVTSSYRSAALERTFALALIKGGHSRLGESLNAVVDGRLVPVILTSHVLFDPEGARRDG
ncbi:2Fe-2S iron-sulfur cluster-binding protein [Cryobacterium psychrophilum]|uniref:Sarcosine oxidase subunit alpha n=1 Tax=Cryobacterium psychrophilum TaxID=41988 RepID=A0A4Y8KSW2_9MICO|nr:2Fe-2S iron-sulfur cluster-binding protein [Cryobacterium psychrophilum]TDW29448.1 heterotetrameric sarcosine oxidase alpha subunit [Cryobacterium psychrophilum]TFD81414.1 FAD-dependent oxidoreductase [Cryobacterium psychrophilum]